MALRYATATLPANESSANTYSFDYSDLRIILIGPTKKVYGLHVSALQQSKFLRAACKQEWGANTRIIKLPEIKPTLFDKYVRYCYTGKCEEFWVGGQSQLKIDANDDPADEETEAKVLVHLYIMSHFLNDIKFGNEVMDTVKEWVEEKGKVFSDELLVLAYQKLPASSALCKFMRDQRIFSPSAPGVVALLDNLPEEAEENIVGELLRRDAEIRAGKKIGNPLEHDYHDKE